MWFVMGTELSTAGLVPISGLSTDKLPDLKMILTLTKKVKK